MLVWSNPDYFFVQLVKLLRLVILWPRLIWTVYVLSGVRLVTLGCMCICVFVYLCICLSQHWGVQEGCSVHTRVPCTKLKCSVGWLRLLCRCSLV